MAKERWGIRGRTAAAKYYLVMTALVASWPVQGVAQSAAAGPLTLPAAGPSNDGKIDNTQHPVGTAVVPLGVLGHIERRGHGRVPLILVPGGGLGWSVWEEFMNRNEDQYTMYAVTPAGYDGTAPWPLPAASRPDGTPDYSAPIWTDAFVDAVVALVRAERLERPVIIGHHIVADYLSTRVATDPRVGAGGLVLVGGNPPAVPLPFNADPKRPGAQDSAARDAFVHNVQAVQFRSITPQDWERGTFSASALSTSIHVGEKLVRARARSPLPTQIRYFLEYLAADLTDVFSAMSIPVLLIPTPVPYERASEQLRLALLQAAGSDSGARALYASMRQRAAAVMARPFRQQVIEDAGIYVMIDQPERFDRAIREFIASLEASGPQR